MKRDDESRVATGGASWKRWTLPAGLLLTAGLAGCSPNAYLEPAPTAKIAPHQGDSDVAEVAGVRIVANGDAWNANPADLGGAFTPVKVDISNQSGEPVDIRYEDFELTASGFTSRALPPYKISGSVDTPLYAGAPVVPAFAYRGFFLAPPYARFYDWDFDRWTGPFAFDFGYYRTYYPMWQESLPTRDMRAEAVPEGVLNPDGRLSGFVFFQKVDKKAGPVSLTFDVVNANTGQSLGKVELPFVAK
jgi:hypothetical protein